MFERYQEIQKRRAEGEQGFTLIELLIVIVVLAILAAIVIFGLSNVSGQSLTSACKADAKSVEVAQEAFRAQGATSIYADSVGTLVTQKYLRGGPGNTTRYKIATTTNGVVTVNNIATGVTADFDTTPTICDNL
jgi:general secretion pathway protein G